MIGAAEPFLVGTNAFEAYPSFSPDGRWLAYSSNETGRFEVYVRRFPDDGKPVRVTNGGGRVPRWLPNGREILYQTEDQRLMVVTCLPADNACSADTARSWTLHRIADTGVLPAFVVRRPFFGTVVTSMPSMSA